MLHNQNFWCEILIFTKCTKLQLLTFCHSIKTFLELHFFVLEDHKVFFANCLTSDRYNNRAVFQSYFTSWRRGKFAATSSPRRFGNHLECISLVNNLLHCRKLNSRLLENGFISFPDGCTLTVFFLHQQHQQNAKISTLIHQWVIVINLSDFVGTAHKYNVKKKIKVQKFYN